MITLTIIVNVIIDKFFNDPKHETSVSLPQHEIVISLKRKFEIESASLT